MIPITCWCLILLLLISKAIASETPRPFQPRSPKSSDDLKEENRQSSYVPHSRQKRLIWVTDDGRLALPPGTSLIIAPTLAMPFVRHPPDGFHSNLSISIPLTSKFLKSSKNILRKKFFSVDFDKLGLTDNMNPIGTLGP